MARVSSEPVAGRLEVADAVASRILELAAPLRVDVARTQAEIDEIYRLRFAVASEKGWIDAGGDGRERDDYDDDALHVGAWDGGRLVGTQRTLFPAPGRTLPLERAFRVEIEPRDEFVHADRTAIARDYRGDGRHVLLAALMARSWLAWRSRGFHRCTGVVTEPLLKVYREVGLEVELLGEPTEYCGELRSPALFDVPASANRLAGVWLP